ncbi:MAG: 16S rRNA (guanine(527)-N(7))-methyltransferase RsmG [Candidatus Abyssubacteria bacterium]
MRDVGCGPAAPRKSMVRFGPESARMNTFRETLSAEAAALGVLLTPEHRDLLSAHYELLLDWNPRVRLVGTTAPRRAAVELYADSLALTAFVDSLARAGPARMLDIGAGAGLPGLVVKIIHPEWPLTLLESAIKKVAFLKTSVARLGLNGVETVRGRAEVCAHDPAYRERFDLVFCRAVARPARALELALPFVRMGGFFVAQWSGVAQHAWDAADAFGASQYSEKTYTLSGRGGTRSVTAFRKHRPTPGCYPSRSKAGRHRSLC